MIGATAPTQATSPATTSRATAVVLDDNQRRRDELRRRLARCGVLAICFQDDWICLENIHHIQPDFAVLHTDSCDRAARFVYLSKAFRSDFPVAIHSGHRRVAHFIDANWLANLFHLGDPVDDETFQHAVTCMTAAERNGQGPVMVAGSPERSKLMQGLPMLGLSRDPILIEGECGVGKRLIAKAIHSYSARRRSSMVVVNASEISSAWIRRAQTVSERSEQPSGWAAINVIENIETLPIALQSQLLLLLDGNSSRFMPDRDTDPSAPLITLSCRDLADLVRQGRFRQDLYHRLSVLKLAVPPLRGRAADIIALAEYFAAHYGIRLRGTVVRLSESVLRKMAACHWPGNVPELKHLIEHMVRTANGVRINDWPRRESADSPNEDLAIDPAEIRRFLDTHQGISLRKARSRYAMQVEKTLMKKALAQTQGNCKKAAGLLNISYKSMLNKVKAYKLN